MSNLVFLQISVDIKFAMHGHAVDLWLMFGSPVLKRFCSLTRHVSILMLQILNVIERKKNERSSEDVLANNQKRKRSWCCVQNTAYSTCIIITTKRSLAVLWRARGRHLHVQLLGVFFTEVIKQVRCSCPLVIQGMPLDFVRQNKILHVVGLSLAWQNNTKATSHANRSLHRERDCVISWT